jgi:carboxylate-amine ligase
MHWMAFRASDAGRRTVGVEEEFLLVDPASGQARAIAAAVLMAGADDEELTGELQAEQLETGTRPCRDLEELGVELRRTRATARAAARAVGAEPVALATSPIPVEPTPSPGKRYRRMIKRFGLTGAEQLTCGCHVHVAVESDEEGVAVLDRIRPWLAPLLAVSANSPFWNGTDSGYCSYRSQVWGRWPSSGPTGVFGSADRYAAVTEAMLATKTVLDDGMIYFDARLSRRHPTVEVRIADVCREPDDAVLVAALVRALVDTAAGEWQRGVAPDPVPVEVLRLAAWRAGRSGIEATLVDPRTWTPAPATEVLHALVDHVGEALRANGDRDAVTELLDAVLARGTGAARQLAVFGRDGDLHAVVRDAIAQDD